MPAAHTESSAGGTSQGLPPTPDLPLDTLAAWAQQESRYALVFLDPEGQVLGLTPAASQLLGYRPDELVGRSFSQFFTRRDVALELHLQELNVAQRVGHSEDDRWHRRKNGSLVWISGGVTPVRAADGTLLGFVKVMADRTDIRTQIEALEHRIAALGRERRDGFKPMAHEFANLLGTATQSLNALRRAAPGARASLEDSLSAQLAALEVWSSSATLVPLVATLVMMNARYVLYGAAIQPWLSQARPAQSAASLYLLGDGNWALAMREYHAGYRDAGFILGSGLASFLPWVLGTLAGHGLAHSVPNPAAWGLDFMLVAFAAAIGLSMWKGRSDLAPVAVAAGVAWLFHRFVPGAWYILAAGIAAGCVGAIRHGR